MDIGVGGGRTGEGVWRVWWRWEKSFGPLVAEERLEYAEREDMWEVKELTLEGSPPTLLFDDDVFKANGWAEPLWLCVVCG